MQTNTCHTPMESLLSQLNYAVCFIAIAQIAPELSANDGTYPSVCM